MQMLADIATLMKGFALVGYNPQSEQWFAVWKRTLMVVTEFNSENLSDFFWGHTRLKVTPDERLNQELLNRTMAHMNSISK